MTVPSEPAKIIVFQGLSSACLRERLLVEYRTAARRRIGGALWIGPSPEAVDAARACLIAPGSGDSLLGSLMFDWDGLARHIVRRRDPAARLVNPGERRLLLQEVVGSLKHEKRLVWFERIADSRGFFDSLEGTIAELAAANIAPESLGSAESSLPDRADKRPELALILEAFHQRLQRSHFIDATELLPTAAALLRGSERNPLPDVEAVFVDGLSNLNSSRLELLSRLLSKSAMRGWLTLPGEASARREELFRNARITVASIEARFGPIECVAVEDESEPAGLAHLRRSIFPGAGSPLHAESAAGISLIEAPGAVGEARLIARQIRSLLADGAKPRHSLFDEGARPERILVVARHLDGARTLLAEVFDEYRVPFHMEGDEPLSRAAIVSALLRAFRLPEENWPFAGVTALLRSSFFRPAWPECRDDPELPRHAEALLRVLGEPRGRESVLRAVDTWADSPPEGLEDEQAEEPRRLRRIRLARQCRPFLQRFFKAWERIPLQGTAAQFAGVLREFAGELGFTAAANDHDTLALTQLWRELDRWVEIEGTRSRPEPLSRAAFLRSLSALIGSRPQADPGNPSGKVRIRGAESAVDLEADYLFLLGLGERSFPDLAPPDSLLDDVDRNDLRRHDAALACSGDERLAGEMLLFHRLAALPRKGLILSFAAIDEKGQPLLPSSFLRAARDCFEEGGISAERQRMLIEGYASRLAISPAEVRVRFAAAMSRRSPESGAWSNPRLPPDVTANLQAAARMARRRFRSDTFDIYDGWLERPRVVQELGEMFGPERVLSPTALEAYVACPFRFFVGNVLGLEALEEPVEEVEASRRGSAFHRALARFHAKLIPSGSVSVPEDAAEQLQSEISKAVKEYQQRASSEAARVLWELEAKRLQRSAARYPGHWQRFIDPWKEKNAAPSPLRLEADFGLRFWDAAGKRLEQQTQPLIIDVGGVEVRIGGRIDRLDWANLSGVQPGIAELSEEIGFWIIDYKTGRATSYTAGDLARFEKLQLPLYALAVEKVFLAGKKARPLGLAYWLVTGGGPKTVLPEVKAGPQRFSWLNSPEKWQRFRQQLEEWVATLAGHIRQGHFPLAPRSEWCTATCDFSEMCRIAQSRGTGKLFSLPLPVVVKEEAEKT